MKVIDLLNKIANNEEVPKKVMYKNEIWEYYKDLEDYIRAGKPNTLFTMYYIHKILNDEIKIIEEKPKKIEELEILPDNEYYSNEVLYRKINELTKAVNYLLEKGNEE